jgi:DNA polymerase elongation subunit (family B)
MLYDPRLGSAITLTGQYIILKVGQTCDTKFNQFFKTDNEKYTLYSDTDSAFFTLGNVVKKYWSDKTDLQITDALDKLVETKLRPFIDEATDEIARIQNHYTKTIYFKRENICSSGFILGKKRYALKVYDSEGVRYPEGDYKIMGIEVVRSSTPMIARKLLKECVVSVIDKDIDRVRQIVENARKQFRTDSPEAIAFPRSANNLEEYSDGTSIYRKATPIAVRGALLFNHYVKAHNLTGKYEFIGDIIIIFILNNH